MMRHGAIRFLLILSLAAVAAPQLSHAQTQSRLSAEDEILSTLLSRGYAIVENERTWLGRQRILAQKDGTSREVVFIPGTGEILRDYSVRLAATTGERLAGDGHSETGLAAASGGGLGVTSSADASPGLSVGESLGTGRVSQGDNATAGTAP